MESITIKGLYPIGEGAGYAGGIISSTIDGIKMVELAIEKKCKNRIFYMIYRNPLFYEL